MENEKYGIWCSVWGGVTGHRQAWLKEDDKIWTGTEEEAMKRATELNAAQRMSTAHFSYEVQPYY